MSFITILLFFAYSFGLGFAVSSFVKNSENFLERNLMRIGLGLSMLPFLAIALNIMGIPADWRIILALSMAYPAYSLFRSYTSKGYKNFNFQFRLTKPGISILAMLAIFAANFYVYGTGAFNYPYLEDDDSWGHAQTAKYYSIEKNVFSDTTTKVRYITPYPPAYAVVMGILHQTNDSIYWTLKLFNALIVSMSTIFFYFFIKEFSGNSNKALFAAFAMASIPAFLSHFIWAISLSVPMYFVSFYALERIKHDNKWWIVSGLVMFTTLTSSPTHSTYFGLFFALYLMAKIALERKLLLRHIAAGAFGLALSFLFWWLPMLMRYGVAGTLKGVGFNVGYAKELGLGTALTGTGDRAYSFSDFFIAKGQNMINSPIGIGIFLSLLAIVAVALLFLRFKHLLKKENHWLVITFVWLLFTLYAVNAANMPIKLSPFRTWMLLAIPVCILAAEGLLNLMSAAKASAGKIGMYALLVILLTGIYFTSTQQKIAVNTATWPPGGFWTYVKDESGRAYSPELEGYLWIKDNIAPDTKAFAFVIDGPIIGMDKFICYWCDDIMDFKKNGANKTAEETHSFLKERDYEYIIIDGQYAKAFGAEEANAKLQELAQSGLFKPAFQNNGAVIFMVN